MTALYLELCPGTRDEWSSGGGGGALRISRSRANGKGTQEVEEGELGAGALSIQVGSALSEFK